MIKNFLVGLAIIMTVLLISLGVKYWSVFETKTVGVSQSNARREVFEQTQSFVEGKRQDLIKYHYEWQKAKIEDKTIIESTVRISMANVDDKVIANSPELYDFLKKCKYGN